MPGPERPQLGENNTLIANRISSIIIQASLESISPLDSVAVGLRVLTDFVRVFAVEGVDVRALVLEIVDDTLEMPLNERKQELADELRAVEAKERKGAH